MPSAATALTRWTSIFASATRCTRSAATAALRTISRIVATSDNATPPRPFCASNPYSAPSPEGGGLSRACRADFQRRPDDAPISTWPRSRLRGTSEQVTSHEKGGGPHVAEHPGCADRPHPVLRRCWHQPRLAPSGRTGTVAHEARQRRDGRHNYRPRVGASESFGEASGQAAAAGNPDPCPLPRRRRGVHLSDIDRGANILRNTAPARSENISIVVRRSGSALQDGVGFRAEGFRLA